MCPISLCVCWGSVRGRELGGGPAGGDEAAVASPDPDLELGGALAVVPGSDHRDDPGDRHRLEYLDWDEELHPHPAAREEPFPEGADEALSEEPELLGALDDG